MFYGIRQFSLLPGGTCEELTRAEKTRETSFEAI